MLHAKGSKHPTPRRDSHIWISISKSISSLSCEGFIGWLLPASFVSSLYPSIEFTRDNYHETIETRRLHSIELCPPVILPRDLQLDNSPRIHTCAGVFFKDGTVILARCWSVPHLSQYNPPAVFFRHCFATTVPHWVQWGGGWLTFPATGGRTWDREDGRDSKGVEEGKWCGEAGRSGTPLKRSQGWGAEEGCAWVWAAKS